MTTTTAVAIRDDQTTFDDLQRKALVHMGADSAGPADLAVFFHVCKRTGLDPFARQIYLIKRDGKQTIQTGIDGLRLVAQRTAERTGEAFGYEDTLWCGADGQWRDVWTGTEPPAAAKVCVVRNGQRFPAVALYGEYVQTYRDKQTGDVRPTKTWTEKAAHMLAKCGEAAALRKAFPQDLSGVYTADEMSAAQSHPRSPRATAEMFTQPVADVTDAEVVETPVEDEWEPRAITQAQRRAMFAAFTAAGFDTEARSTEGRQARLDYIGRALGRVVASTNDLTKREAGVVLDMLASDAQKVAEPEEPQP